MMSVGLRGRRRFAFLGLVVAAAVAAGAAYATIPDGAGVINGCYTNKVGFLRLVDPSAGQKCTSLETPISWNQKGPKGDPGPQGAAGPAGPPGPAGGSLTSIDNLEGIPCTGVNSKPATIHVSYGTGIEAPVTLVCVTHLVANPGPFTVHVAGGTLSIGFFGDLPLPTSGWQFTGQIDLGGKVTVPGSGFQLSNIPFDSTNDIGGFSSVHVVGTISFASTGVAGSLIPDGGAASLAGGLYATITLTATAQILGQSTQLYSGTCALGSAASPLPLTLTTASPGIPYSQTTGALTLSSPFTAPSLDSCNPALPNIYAFLLNLFAGTDRITFSGATDPILKAP
jgi:hypothetical protein